MEDVETFMLLQGELYLKVVPLDWIIFSVILGYLTDEDNEIHMFLIPSNAHSELDFSMRPCVTSSCCRPQLGDRTTTSTMNVDIDYNFTIF